MFFLPWLTAMTFRLLRISLVSLLIERMSQPIKRGAWLKVCIVLLDTFVLDLG